MVQGPGDLHAPLPLDAGASLLQVAVGGAQQRFTQSQTLASPPSRPFLSPFCGDPGLKLPRYPHLLSGQPAISASHSLSFPICKVGLLIGWF